MTREDGVRGDWPLVGRVAELASIADSVLGSPGGGFVVAGAVGVGKTRLASEALARIAAAGGRRTAHAQGARALRGIPFGALAQLLPERLVAGPGRRNVIRAAAVALAGQQPLVVFIDDAHHLDEHSAGLLHHLASSKLVSVIVTVATGEPAPDPVRLLWKEGLCERLELQALSRAEVELLLATVLEGPVDGVTAHRMFDATRGNPLYLREIVRKGLETGSLARQSDVWRWTGPLAISGWLKDIISDRLTRLSAAERDVLEIVASAESIELGVINAVASPETVESLERHGHISMVEDGSRICVRVAHPLQGEILRALTPRARVRPIARRLADALHATGGRRREDLLRLAAWRVEASMPESPEVLVEAAVRACDLMDPLLAWRLAEAAAQAGGGFEADMLVARALMGRRRFVDADRDLARLARGASDDRARAAALGTQAQNLYWNLQRPEQALDVLRDMHMGAETTVTRNEAAAGRAQVLFFEGRTSESVDAVRNVDWDDTTSRTIAMGLPPILYTHALRGETSRSWRCYEQHEDRLSEAIHECPAGAAIIPGLRLLISSSHGDPSGMVAAMDEVDRDALERGADWLRATAVFGYGWAARLRGEYRSAVNWFKESLALVDEVDLTDQRRRSLAELALSLAMLGRVGDAETALAEATVGRPAGILLRSSVSQAKAWVAAARGEITKAVSICLEEADASAADQLRVFELWALHDAVRLGDAKQVAGRLAGLAREIEGPLSSAAAAHAGALATGNAQALEDASAVFEEMTLRLLAAEAAATAAHLYEREGLRGRTLTARARAHALVARCDGVRTPALNGLDGTLPLTRRETEVAGLAARGLSNRAIAERLVVSVRTIDNHLHATYAKLGIAGRVELAEALAPSAPPDDQGSVHAKGQAVGHRDPWTDGGRAVEGTGTDRPPRRWLTLEAASWNATRLMSGFPRRSLSR